MKIVRIGSESGYVTATYRKSLLTQLQKAKERLSALNYPNEIAEARGTIKGLRIALALVLAQEAESEGGAA
jgi:hypothetical protein